MGECNISGKRGQVMAEAAENKSLTIHEIYKSIQGESTWAGLPCTFVRLTGCNLRCVWCDTEYAFFEGERMAVDDVLERVRDLDCSLVEITGGEPLLQKNCPSLARALLESGFQVLVETSGALPIDILPEGVIRIMDLKCPDSGEEAKNDWSNIEKLQSQDEVKFVISSRHDFEWAAAVVNKYRLHERCSAILFSPVFSKVEPANLAEWILKEKLPVRFQLQLHKYVWDPRQRGV